MWYFMEADRRTADCSARTCTPRWTARHPVHTQQQCRTIYPQHDAVLTNNSVRYKHSNNPSWPDIRVDLLSLVLLLLRIYPDELIRRLSEYSHRRTNVQLRKTHVRRLNIRCTSSGWNRWNESLRSEVKTRGRQPEPRQHMIARTLSTIGQWRIGSPREKARNKRGMVLPVVRYRYALCGVTPHGSLIKEWPETLRAVFSVYGETWGPLGDGELPARLDGKWHGL